MSSRRRFVRRDAVSRRRNDPDASIGADFHIEIIIGPTRRSGLAGLETLHQLLRAFLIGAGKDALAHPFQSAGDILLFLQLGHLRPQHRQIVKLPFQLGFVADQTFQFLLEKLAEKNK